MLLYQFEISPFCDKVRRVLNLKRQAYDIENVSVARTLSGYVQLYCIAATREGEALLAGYPAVRDWMRRTDAATGKLA